MKNQERDIKALQLEVVEVRGQLKSNQGQTLHDLELQQEIITLKQKVKIITKENERLISESKATKDKYDGALVQLEDALKLVERHLQNSENLKQEIITMGKQYKQLNDEAITTKLSLEETTDKLGVQGKEYAAAVMSWKEKEENSTNIIEKQNESLASLQKKISNLEEQNTSWAQQNMQIKQELTELKVELNKPREMNGVQTDLSMISMTDSECQVAAHIVSTASQVDSPERMHTPSQTYIPVVAYASTQTIIPLTVTAKGALQHDQASQTFESVDISDQFQTYHGGNLLDKGQAQMHGGQDLSDKDHSQVNGCGDMSDQGQGQKEEDGTIPSPNNQRSHENYKRQDWKDQAIQIGDGEEIGYLGCKLSLHGHCVTRENVSEIAKVNIERNGKKAQSVHVPLTDNDVNKMVTGDVKDVADIKEKNEMNTFEAVKAFEKITINSLKQSEGSKENGSNEDTMSVCKESDETGNASVLKRECLKQYQSQNMKKETEDENNSENNEKVLDDNTRKTTEDVTCTSNIKIKQLSLDAKLDTGKVEESVNKGFKESQRNSFQLGSPSREAVKMMHQVKSAVDESKGGVLSRYGTSPSGHALSLKLPGKRVIQRKYAETSFPLIGYEVAGKTEKKVSTPEQSIRQNCLSEVTSPKLGGDRMIQKFASSLTRSSPKRSQLPIFIKNRVTSENRYSPIEFGRQDEDSDIKLVHQKGILKDMQVNTRKDKKSVIFGSVQQKALEDTSADSEVSLSEQLIISDSDEEEDDSNITKRYKRTIQQIMKKGQTKKMKYE